MNALQKALDEIKFRIPPHVLNETFKSRTQSWRDRDMSIDESILNKVIRPRVVVDTNIVGGIEMYIPLYGAEIQQVDNYTYVLRIPKELTQNRTILSALSISYFNSNTMGAYGGSSSYLGGQACSKNDVLGAANAVFDSFSSAPVTGTAQLRLVGENTIHVIDRGFFIQSAFLRCIVESDRELSNLQVRTYLAFSKLCELAVKSYIYNNMTITIDMAFLEGGRELGSFKTTVESYSDAEQMYQDFLKEKWGKINFMNDGERMARFLKSTIGSMK